MKRHIKKIITGTLIIAILAIAYFWGGNAPGLSEKPTANPDIPQSVAIKENVVIPADDNTDKLAPSDIPSDPESIEYSKEHGMIINEETGKDKYGTAPVPKGTPVPVEPEEAEITSKELTCTLSVRCDTILNNMAWLNPEKVELVPKDGVIFAETTVTFFEGESVFNVLVREMKKNKIHMEFVNTPAYNSAYIEGIGNLYEFDCGELSGWMYRVNGTFPGYGCSRYQLNPGDKIEFVYTCDLGKDVGGEYSARNGM